MGHYGRHSTKSYTVALKCTFLIILRLPLWLTHSARFSLIKSLSFALPFPSYSHSRVFNPPNTRNVLQNLSCATADEVRHLIFRAPCKSSDLHPIPTSLVKDCIDTLITPITSIINLTLPKLSSLHTLSLPSSPPFEGFLAQ